MDPSGHPPPPPRGEPVPRAPAPRGRYLPRRRLPGHPPPPEGPPPLPPGPRGAYLPRPGRPSAGAGPVAARRGSARRGAGCAITRRRASGRGRAAPVRAAPLLLPSPVRGGRRGRGPGAAREAPQAEGPFFYRRVGVSVSSGRGELRPARGGVSPPLPLPAPPAVGNRGRPGNRQAARPGADCALSAPPPPPSRRR